MNPVVMQHVLAVASVVVGPATPTDAPIPRAAANAQYAPAIAPGPNGEALAVWEDNRYGGTTALVATRLDLATGTVLDVRGFLLDRRGHAPSVAFDGTDYVVTYVANDDDDVVVRHISSAGAIVDAMPIVVAAASGYGSVPRIACASATCLIAWQMGGQVTRVNARTLAGSTLGTTFDPSTAGATVVNGHPAVGATSSSFFVAWEDQRTAGKLHDIYARVVDGAGTLGSEVAVATSTYDETAPTIAWNGANFLIALTTTTVSNTRDIVARRMSSTGTGVGGMVAITSMAGDQTSPSATALTSGSGDYYVTLVDESTGLGDVHGTRVSSAGAVLEDAATSGFTIASGAFSSELAPAVVPTESGEFAIIFTENAAATVSNDIWLKSINDTNGTFGNLVMAVSFSVNRQNAVTVGRGTSGYMLAWEDNRDSAGNDIYGMRLDAAGLPLEQTAIAIGTGGNNGVTEPRVVHVGTTYEVLWLAGVNVLARKVGEADGVPAGAAFAATKDLDGAMSLQAASNGTDVLVAYMYLPQGVATSAARVALLTGGTTPGDPIELTSYGAIGKPAATTDGWVVPWVDVESTNVTRMSANGSIIDVTPIQLEAASYSVPQIAVEGTTAVAAWTASDNLVHVRRVDLATGMVASGTVVLGTAPCVVRSLSLTGGVAFVVWDYKPGTTSDVMGARIDAATLTRIDATDIPLVADANEDRGASMAGDGAGGGILAWTHLDSTSATNALRARYATLAGLVPPAEPDGTTTLPDGGVAPDAPGPAEMGDGGGCCESTPRSPSGPFVIAGLLAAVLMRRRRG